MPRKKPVKEATVVADVTETFVNPFSGATEMKVGSQMIIDNIDREIDIEDQRNIPRYNDGDSIDFIVKSANGKTARGKYDIVKLLNQLGSLLGGSNNVVYDKPTQTIHVKGRFNVMECCNIHQPPENIIRVAQNLAGIRQNAEQERAASGVYGGY